jgi:predicted Zn-dependent protease
MVEMGSVYCRAGNYADAVPFLKQVLTRDSNNYEANYRLGQAYLTLGKHDQAILYLEHATQANPEKSNPYYLLNRAYKALGQPEKSATALARFKRLKAAGN